MAEVVLQGVTKRYGDVVVVKPTDLTITDGELLVLVGPSGCGKSTTLRMIAGLEEISEGEISIGGNQVNDLPPKDRDIAMVFQSYALYPHMDVYENMAFGLRLRRMPEDEIRARVEDAASVLQLGNLLERFPRDLSGGQRQRVAMGRALVRKPAVFLFDEPLSNLDAKLRVQMRAEIARLHQRLNATIVYVTHDQVEAMTLADRIVIIREGEVQQVGAPLEVYSSPANAFVGGFIGSPAMNFLPAEIMGTGAEMSITGDGFCVPVPKPLLKHVATRGARNLLLGVRPEHFQPLAADDPDAAIVCEVEVVEPMGSEVLITTRVGEVPVTVRAFPDQAPRVGDRIGLSPEPARIHLFDTETERALVPPPEAPEAPAGRTVGLEAEDSEETAAVKAAPPARRGLMAKLAVGLILLVFAGLVYLTLPTQEETALAGEESPDAEPLPRKRVVLWHSYQAVERQALDKLVARFNQVQGRIQVETLAIPYGSFVDKLNAALPRGQGPDLFLFAHDRVGDWAESGVLEPIEFWTNEATVRRFFPKTLEALTYEGSLYGLPMAFKTCALYYNRKLVETPPSTTKQMIFMAQSLTNLPERRFGLAYENTKLFYHSAWLHGYGGRVFDDRGRLALPSPKASRSLEFAAWLRNVGRILPSEVTSVMAASLFNQGRAAMVISGPWFRGEIDEGVEYGVALLPEVHETGLPAQPFMTAEGLLISARSRVKRQAFEVAAYLTSDESALVRLLEAKQNVANWKSYNDKRARKDGVLSVFRAQVDRSVLVPNTPDMRVAWSPLDRALADHIAGRMSADEAVRRAAEEIRRYVEGRKP